MEDAEIIIGDLQGLLKVLLVDAVEQADRGKRKTTVLERTSHTHPSDDFQEFFDEYDGNSSDPLLPIALARIWKYFPYWQELDGKIGTAEDPGDGLLYKETHFEQAQNVLQALYQAWSNARDLVKQSPPSNLPKVGKIGLILFHMRQPLLLQDFIDNRCEDKDLPFERDRLAVVLKPQHVDYATTFTTEQRRAVPRNWGKGEHLQIADEEEPLPLEVEKVYVPGSYGRVYSVRDPSGARYARKEQLTDSEQLSAAARRHLEEETDRLRNLKHRHVVEIIKTYERGRAYGILLQPVATNDLERLLGRNAKDRFCADEGCRDSVWLRPLFLTAFGCLSQGLAYIHGRDIRHKDVKPANILYERANKKQKKPARFLWADFGLAYDFSKSGNSKTQSTSIYSPRYAAPEIVASSYRANEKDRRLSTRDMTSLNSIREVESNRSTDVEVVNSVWTVFKAIDTHGRAADVFSLGCVFLEMLAGLIKEDLPLEKHDPNDGKRMFSYNIASLHVWAKTRLESADDRTDWTDLKPLFALAISMITAVPDDRPLIQDVVGKLKEAHSAAAKNGSKTDYFCQECWEELKAQGKSPSNEVRKPSFATSSPTSSSPTSSRPLIGQNLLKRASTSLSAKTLRPKLQNHAPRARSAVAGS